MRVGWAIAAGLLLGGAVGWWLLEREQRPDGPASPEATAASVSAPGPQLYRWRDSQGVLQVSDKPPASGDYEVVTLRTDQNVVPMSGPAPAPLTPDD
jgi:hypothetical protein